MLASSDDWCDGNTLWVNIYFISETKNWWEIYNIGTLQCIATLLDKSTTLLIWGVRVIGGYRWSYKCINTTFLVSRLKMNIFGNLFVSDNKISHSALSTQIFSS